MIRRILVDFARSRGYQKRGGGAQQVLFTQALKVAEGQPTDVVALDDALEELAQVDERKSRVVLPARRSCSSGEPTSACAGSRVRSCSTRIIRRRTISSRRPIAASDGPRMPSAR